MLDYAWFIIAASNGDVDEIKYRDLLESELNVAGRNEGQRLASNWKVGKSIKREK